MDDLISRKALLAEYDRVHIGEPGNARKLIEDAPAVQEWISVKDERKPKDRNNYFIAYVFGDSDMHFFGESIYHAYEGNGIVDRPHFSNEGVEGMRVTHWMEISKLPQPPKGE